MVDEYLNAEFVLPEVDKAFKGTLHLSEKDNYFILNENPFGRHTWQSIQMAYAKTQSRVYSCVQCLLFKTKNHQQYYYTITELYDGEIENAESLSLNGLTARIFFLTSWLNPRLIEQKFINNDEYYITLNVKQRKEFKYKLDEYFELVLEAFTSINFQKNQIQLTDKSIFKINSLTNSSRSKLFSLFYSFLIFFTLFLRKIPRTTSLEFINETKEFALQGLPSEIEESPVDILLSFEDIENFEEIIQNYFKDRDQYNLIIQLYQAGLEKLDPEIIFLHLTQGLELFHRSFCQNDPGVLNEIAEKLKEESIANTIYKEWKQIMIYYDLFTKSEESHFDILFPLPKKDFVKYLRNSRNFYTHYTNKESVWSHFELYGINNVLRVWLAVLILQRLKVSNSKINIYIKKQSHFLREDDIFKNIYSMRYKNDFTL